MLLGPPQHRLGPRDGVRSLSWRYRDALHAGAGIPNAAAGSQATEFRTQLTQGQINVHQAKVRP